MDTELTSPARYLTVSLRRIEHLQQRLQQASQRLTRWRIACFFMVLFLCAILLEFSGTLASILAAVLGCVMFGVLVRQHQKVRRQQRQCQRAVRLKKSHQARRHLRWEQIPEVPHSPPLPEHAFEIDLDITGPHSLYRLLHTCVTAEGGERLKSWLLQSNASVATLQERQQRVHRLRPFVAWRDRLHLNLEEAASSYRQATASDSDHWQSNTALQRLQAASVHRPGGPLVVLSVMALCTALLYGLSSFGIVPALAWQVSLVLYGLMYWQQRRHIGDLFLESQSLQFEFHRLAVLFEQMENFMPGKTGVLKPLFTSFHQSNKPSVLLQRLSRVVAAASLQGNPLLWGGVNLLMPWDMFFAWRYEKLKPTLKQKLPESMEALWEIEALASLAHYAWSDPARPFPHFQKDGLSGIGIGHPLLPPTGKVRNDFTLSQTGEGFLITGSNMAGKSTFLKSLGLNIVLARAGSVVDCNAFSLCDMRLMTCIRVSDSVSDGFSYFYAEVRRLKAILEAVESHTEVPVFYLVDEIFKGTNNRERLLGSQAYLKALAGARAMGGVSTHDLELVQLADAHPLWKNYHFREFIQDKKMVFDYTLREGPCPTTNALRIMALEGLPVPASADPL